MQILAPSSLQLVVEFNQVFLSYIELTDLTSALDLLRENYDSVIDPQTVKEIQTTYVTRLVFILSITRLPLNVVLLDLITLHSRTHYSHDLLP